MSHCLANGWFICVQVIRGAVRLNYQSLSTGDGVAISQEKHITFCGASNDAKVLLFDMAVLV